MIRLKVQILFAILVAVFSGKVVIGAYNPTWKSLDTRPLPQWYDDAKIGIFIHWGVYSVPGYGNEWFWSNWKKSGLEDYVTFMKNYYKPGFNYQEFAKDFRAEVFEPPKWATLFLDSGAKYVVLTSKHHDGYTLWPSSRSNSWNSKDVGPHRDVVQELSAAIRARALKFGLQYSLYEWFNPLYMDDKANGYNQQNYVVNKVHPELYDLVNKYRPDILWSDGEWEASAKYWNSAEFVAWLYNTSPVSQTVVTNDRWGNDTKCVHGGFLTCSEHYNPGVLQKRKWENAFSLDKNSWGHRDDGTLENYMSSEELIKELVTTISCGGNALINVGPTSHGTIQPIFEERLLDMGAWLKLNGEAIYASKPWRLQNDTKTAGVWYTQKIATPGRRNVYALVVEYPYDTNGIDLYGLAGHLDNASTVSLLGYPKPLVWKENYDCLHIQFPDKHLIDQIGLKYTWVFKINVPID